MIKRKVFSLILILTLLITGCSFGGNSEDTGDSSSSEKSTTPAVDITLDTSDMFSKRDYQSDYDVEDSTAITLNGSSASCDSDSVQITDGTVTITDEGTYILSGSLDDGMVIVNAKEDSKVQLVLNGVTIQSKTSAAIYVLQADKVFVTLADNSENTLSNGGEFTAIDDNNIDSVIFSKDDLTLNGTGSLTINSPAGHGIVSKDDLVITSGTYNITANNHAISGKDSVRIADGNFTLTSEKDAIHSSNSDDSSSGFVYIANGTYQVTAQGDGISGSACVQIDDGDFTIVSGGGSANASQHHGGGGMPSGQDFQKMGKKKSTESTDESADSNESQAAAPEMPSEMANAEGSMPAAHEKHSEMAKADRSMTN
jgi:hypothetical protein